MEKKIIYDVYLYRYGKEPAEIAKGADRAEADRIIASCVKKGSVIMLECTEIREGSPVRYMGYTEKYCVRDDIGTTQRAGSAFMASKIFEVGPDGTVAARNDLEGFIFDREWLDRHRESACRPAAKPYPVRRPTECRTRKPAHAGNGVQTMYPENSGIPEYI